MSMEARRMLKWKCLVSMEDDRREVRRSVKRPAYE